MRKPTKKSTIAVIAVLAALAVGVAVLAVLGGREAAPGRRLREDAVFLVTVGGTEHRVTVEDIESLGPREIEANYKKSGKDPETRVYTGVPFAAVLRLKGIGAETLRSATFSAADTYSSILPMEDALDEENCYIVLDAGDEGPFRMILARDRFSQRWCKLLTGVALK
ncbi:MAG: hypothetical protein LBB75_06950 [Oscillospiraceae bacterium]|jgi:hypothetical protein|nr:hypothetical protein [Oscillospiraceae bacterium]